VAGTGTAAAAAAGGKPCERSGAAGSGGVMEVGLEAAVAAVGGDSGGDPGKSVVAPGIAATGVV
jgi:hypothetical protein